MSETRLSSRIPEGRGPARLSRLLRGIAAASVVAALASGAALAEDPGTPMLISAAPPGGTPVTVTGKVTTVSVARHYLVTDADGAPIVITRRTTFHRLPGALGGIAVGRTVRVRAVRVNGVLYAAALEQVSAGLPQTL